MCTQSDANSTFSRCVRVAGAAYALGGFAQRADIANDTLVPGSSENHVGGPYRAHARRTAAAPRLRRLVVAKG